MRETDLCQFLQSRFTRVGAELVTSETDLIGFVFSATFSLLKFPVED